MTIGAGARTGADVRVGAGVRTRVKASRTALRILSKSSSEYMGTLVAKIALAIEGFVPEGPAGWSDNLSPDSGGSNIMVTRLINHMISTHDYSHNLVI